MTISLVGGSIYVGISAIESASVYFQSKNSHNFQTMHKVKNFVAALNISALLYAAYRLYYNTGFTNLVSHDNGIILGYSTVALVAVGVLLYLAVDKANQYLSANVNAELKDWPAKCGIEVPKDELKNIEVKKESSSYQRKKQFIQVVQIISSIAMVCLSANPYFYAGAAVLQLYSLVKTTQWKWISFERSFNTGKTGEGAQNFKIGYFCSMLPTKNVDNCAICQEAAAKTQFCANHVFHEDCIIGAVYGKSGDFAKAAKYDRKIKQEMRNGVYTGVDHVEYTVYFPKNNLPSCPLCKTCPEYNELHINVDDLHGLKQSTIEAKVVIIS